MKRDGEEMTLVEAIISINCLSKDEKLRPHFIICSKQWVDKITPYVDNEISQRCHIEEFDI